MTISLRLSDEEARLFKSYAGLHGLSVSDLVRQAVRERIEDELDLEDYQKAMEVYKADPVTFSHEQVKAMVEAES